MSIATGFVDFSTGRESIVTAPGPDSPTEIRVFAFPLLKPIGKADERGTETANTDQPLNTASFMPFGRAYRGGVSLATGWLAGALGGAKRIIVSQLADKGSVKIFSSGSALDGGPSIYLQSPLQHGHGAHFREIGQLPAIRWIWRNTGRHNQHHDGRQPAGQRCCGRTHRRKRPQIRVRQTDSVEDARSRASRTSLVRKRIAASHSGRRLVEWI